MVVDVGGVEIAGRVAGMEGGDGCRGSHTV